MIHDLFPQYDKNKVGLSSQPFKRETILHFNFCIRSHRRFMQRPRKGLNAFWKNYEFKKTLNNYGFFLVKNLNLRKCWVDCDHVNLTMRCLW